MRQLNYNNYNLLDCFKSKYLNKKNGENLYKIFYNKDPKDLKTFIKNQPDFNEFLNKKE